MLKKVNYESHSNSYWVNLTPDELKLVAALLWKVRLGNGNKFKDAALQISEGIDECAGVLFSEDASEEVGVYFSLEDMDGKIGAIINSPYATIEISGGAGGQAALPTP
jgi:hypothetical protein